MDWTLQAEVGSRTGMSSLDIIYFRAGKGSGRRLRVAGWACNPREVGRVLEMRILAPSLQDFSLFYMFSGFFGGSPGPRDAGSTFRSSSQSPKSNSALSEWF